MKKQMIWLSAPFVFLLLILMLSTPISAEIIEGNCGPEKYETDVKWSLDTETGLLVISGEGKMGSKPWQSLTYQDTVVTVVIQSGVTEICEGAFYDCNHLTSITLPKGLIAIGKLAFYKCEKMTQIALPNTLEKLGEGAFEFCSGLTEIVLPQNIKHIGNGAFYNCQNLKEIVIPYGITAIGDETFKHCINLEKIVLPDTVTSIGNAAFYGCKLKTVELPTGLKNLGGEAFAYSAIEEITIPPMVTSIEMMAFYNCSYLEKVNLPNRIDIIGQNSYQGCVRLSEIVFCGEEYEWNNINKLETWDMYIGDYTLSYHEYVITEKQDIGCHQQACATYQCIFCKKQYTVTDNGYYEHNYDNDRDPDCNLCGESRELPSQDPSSEPPSNNVPQDTAPQDSNTTPIPNIPLEGCQSSLNAHFGWVLMFLLYTVKIFCKKPRNEETNANLSIGRHRRNTNH